MSIFPPEISEKIKAGGSDWLSGSDFDGEGLVLQTVSAEPIQSRFGAEEDNYYVQQDILKAGETFRYTFKDKEGNEKRFDSHSRPFAISLEQAEVEAGDWVRIARTGKAKDTRYQVEKVEAPKTSYDYPQEDIDPSSVPF